MRKISCDINTTYIHFRGAATNRIMYSNVNHPTKTASATSKKYSSSGELSEGMVETIRQRVEMTTKRQEMMATTLAAGEWWGFSNKFQRVLWLAEHRPLPKSSLLSSLVSGLGRCHLAL